MTNAIEVSNLTKQFAEFTLDHVSFQLPRGYIMGLIGMNGAGKTTTIKLLMNMLAKQSGEISILGNRLEAHELEIKQRVAVVFDDTFFVDSWQVKDVEPAISSFYTKWNSAIYHAYLDQFHLSLQKKIKELSRGMRMKLMLAVALSHEAELLILDEPTSGLDPVARDELMDVLMQYVEDERNSILFSTHILSDLEKIADYLTILWDGKVFYSGEKEALKERYCVVKGDLKELSDDLKQHAIGIKTYTTGFDALLEVSQMGYVREGMIVEEVELDDILIYINQAKEAG